MIRVFVYLHAVTSSLICMAERANPPVPSFLFKFVGVVEILAAAGTLAGLGFKYLNFPGGAEMLLLSITALSIIYFMKAFRPPGERREHEGHKGGFGYLFSSVVLPKLGWIACSVTLVGIMYAVLHLRGGGEMLTVGTSVLGLCVVATFYFLATGSNDRGLVRMLYRALPIGLIGIYLFINLPAR
jgi:hypothetical protein